MKEVYMIQATEIITVIGCKFSIRFSKRLYQCVPYSIMLI